MDIRCVARVFNRSENPSLCFVADEARLIDDMRDGGRGHARELGYVFDPHATHRGRFPPQRTGHAESVEMTLRLRFHCFRPNRPALPCHFLHFYCTPLGFTRLSSSEIQALKVTEGIVYLLL